MEKGQADLPKSTFVLRSVPEGREAIKATVVDHIIPHRGNKDLFWDESNWQALCKKCHDKNTMTEDRYKKYKF